mgnify:CR=1
NQMADKKGGFGQHRFDRSALAFIWPTVRLYCLSQALPSSRSRIFLHRSQRALPLVCAAGTQSVILKIHESPRV